MIFLEGETESIVGNGCDSIQKEGESGETRNEGESSNGTIRNDRVDEIPAPITTATEAFRVRTISSQVPITQNVTNDEEPENQTSEINLANGRMGVGYRTRLRKITEISTGKWIWTTKNDK